MTDQQIEKAAQDYANQNFIEAVVREHPWPEAKVAYARAYADGTHFALASQWVSVDEQLPGYDDDVLVFVPAELTFGIPDRYTVAYYNGKDWHTQDGELIRPDFWLPIPKLNPEKEMNMTPTKSQQAQEYAEKQLSDICLMLDYEENKQIGYFHTYDIQKAYIDGYTACEQSMWRSVEEEEPPISKIFLCRDADSVALCTYDGEDMYEVYNDCKCRMPFWMPIPTIPDTNTEKR